MNGASLVGSLRPLFNKPLQLYRNCSSWRYFNQGVAGGSGLLVLAIGIRTLSRFCHDTPERAASKIVNYRFTKLLNELDPEENKKSSFEKVRDDFAQANANLKESDETRKEAIKHISDHFKGIRGELHKSENGFNPEAYSDVYKKLEEARTASIELYTEAYEDKSQEFRSSARLLGEYMIFLKRKLDKLEKKITLEVRHFEIAYDKHHKIPLEVEFNTEEPKKRFSAFVQESISEIREKLEDMDRVVRQEYSEVPSEESIKALRDVVIKTKQSLQNAVSNAEKLYADNRAKRTWVNTLKSCLHLLVAISLIILGAGLLAYSFHPSGVIQSFSCFSHF